MSVTTTPRSAAHLASSPRPPVARRHGIWEVGASAVIWGTSIVVAALWVHGNGVQSLLAGGAETLTTLGRATGLAAANLLLYQVLLMARIPVFEHGIGRDKATTMHRLVGFWSFWLMLAHVALLMFGYAASARTTWWGQLWDFVVTYPGMLLATPGTIALIAVVVLSIRAARRRMRYENWHLLHLYAYVGVGLALPHQLWTGADFQESRLATLYWWTLWAVAAAAVITFRLAVPLWRSNRHGLRVEAVVPDGPRGVTVHLHGRRLEKLGAVAGQFLVFRFLDGPGWTRGHPFSLAAAPDGRRVTVAARVIGDGTQRMTRMTAGTRVLVEGPYGRMTGAVRTGRRLLMLGAGAGVAPLVALLQEQHWDDGEAVLVTRDHQPDHALLTGPVADLVADRGLTWFRLDGPRAHTGSTWLPAAHPIQDGLQLLRHLAGPLRTYDVFLCGPNPWMAAVRKDLAAAGVRPARIHAESFSI